MSDAMNETLTPQEAVRALAKAHDWEAALHGRTQGLTWMVWGLATPATFLTYSFAAVLAEVDGATVPAWVWNVLWVPWILAGVIATVALWRAAALAVPGLETPGERRRATIGGFVASGVIFTAFLLLQPDSAVLPLAVIGAMWMLMASANVWNADLHGRIVGLVVGGILIASAGAMALARIDVASSSVLSIAVSGIVPFAAGLWHIWRA